MLHDLKLHLFNANLGFNSAVSVGFGAPLYLPYIPKGIEVTNGKGISRLLWWL